MKYDVNNKNFGKQREAIFPQKKGNGGNSNDPRFFYEDFFSQFRIINELWEKKNIIVFNVVVIKGKFWCISFNVFILVFHKRLFFDWRKKKTLIVWFKPEKTSNKEKMTNNLGIFETFFFIQVPKFSCISVCYKITYVNDNVW